MGWAKESHRAHSCHCCHTQVWRHTASMCVQTTDTGNTAYSRLQILEILFEEVLLCPPSSQLIDISCTQCNICHSTRSTLFVYLFIYFISFMYYLTCLSKWANLSQHLVQLLQYSGCTLMVGLVFKPHYCCFMRFKNTKLPISWIICLIWI
jgi:hypothetical protein